jgi:hypothetical protein
VSREKGFGEAALLDQYLHKLDSSSSLGNNWAILYLLDQLKGGFRDGPAPAPTVPNSLFSVPRAALGLPCAACLLIVLSLRHRAYRTGRRREARLGIRSVGRQVRTRTRPRHPPSRPRSQRTSTTSTRPPSRRPRRSRPSTPRPATRRPAKGRPPLRPPLRSRPPPTFCRRSRPPLPRDCADGLCCRTTRRRWPSAPFLRTPSTSCRESKAQ